MSELFDFLKILLPAGLVLYGMYVAVHTLLAKQYEQKNLDVKAAYLKETLHLKLQAYERMALYLERISLFELVPRLEHPEFDPVTFRSVLVHEVRNELAHNYAQQIYLSESLWTEIQTATEQQIQLINTAFGEVKEETSVADFKRMLFGILDGLDQEPAQRCLSALRADVQGLLG